MIEVSVHIWSLEFSCRHEDIHVLFFYYIKILINKLTD